MKGYKNCAREWLEGIQNFVWGHLYLWRDVTTRMIINDVLDHNMGPVVTVI